MSRLSFFNKTLLLFNLLILSILLTKSKCFKTTGHFIVARIAEREIEKSAVYPKLLELLSVTGPFTKDAKYPFVESASWADDIKYTGWDLMNKWHFDNIYIDGKRIIPRKEYEGLGLTASKMDVVWAINELKQSLRNTRESLVDDRLGKSINLRMLIHLVGDIHQPLHASTLVNSTFPKGDAGGNAFEIDVPSTRDLHSFWDACLKKYPILRHPLSKRQFTKLEGFVSKIMAEHPADSEEMHQRLKTQSVRDWAYESAKLSLQYAYKDIRPGGVPSKEYVTTGRQIIDQQLAIAGYRLAQVLLSIFEDPEVLESHVKPGSFKKERDFLGAPLSKKQKESLVDVISENSSIKLKLSKLLSHDQSKSNSETRYLIFFVSIMLLIFH